MRFLFFNLINYFVVTMAYSQGQKMIVPDISHMEHAKHSGSGLYVSTSMGTLNPKDIKDDWNISLKTTNTFFHNSPLSLEEYKRLKDEANNVRNSTKSEPFSVYGEKKNIEEPVLLSNFKGNIRGNSIPLDNTLAVSRNGFIVSAINSNIIFAMPDGKITYSRGFSDFYKILGLGTRMFDPRVIYDPEQNRFIVVCLHGSDPSTTHLCIAFSKTEDPNGEWNFYKIKGNPLADDVWFDFPNIAVSKEDLYIAGNMFTEEGGFRYSMIFQIAKNDGFEGTALTWKYYDRVSTNSGNLVFNPVPAMSGWESLTAPGMYFISFSNGNYHINFTDASVRNNPVLISLRTPGPSMSFPPEGRQKGVAVVLNTGGNRIRTALYQHGVLHFAAQTNSVDGDAGLFYGRLNLSDLKVTADILSVPDLDYAYPTLTSFGSKEEDDEVLINYTYTGPDAFPGQAARIIRGTNNDFLWSDEVITKAGLSPIGNNSSESTRWGDYTGACRRFGVKRNESWTVGCFGENRGHSTWIGQFISAEDMQYPVMEFTASLTTTVKDTLITFSDITNISPKSRKWIFQGGIPEVSEDEYPEISYPENGVYDVTLISEFEDRVDTLTKIQFIHILDPLIKPDAIWIKDRDTIYIGETVQFTSLSSSNTLTHKWTFMGGTPPTSTDKNPMVTYNKKGSYLVSLTAGNNVGTNTATINKAITVFEKIPPTASFTANKTIIFPGDSIIFSDKSNNSKQLQWTFEGGSPETSDMRLPVVTYDNIGRYPVKLVAKNDLGVDSIAIQDYVTVGTSFTENTTLINDVLLYPNPASVFSGTVTLSFNIALTGIYKIELKDQQGKLVKSLYQDKIRNGRSVLSFNTNMLTPGIYVLSVSSNTSMHKSIPLVVTP